MDEKTPATRATAGKTYALFVGVDDYADYDASGKSSLEGSFRDVLFLASYCHQDLGVPIENIRTLTSKALTSDLLPYPSATPEWLQKHPEAVGVATVEAVTAGLQWLADNTSDGDTALFGFSGHGAWKVGVGPMLCLSGTSPDLSAGVLALGEVRSLVQSIRQRLVAVLDCCHVAAPAAPRGYRTTSLTPPETKVDLSDDDFDVSDRVFLGARPGKHAFQMPLGRFAHGALTFALVTSAKRWLCSNGASHGSYKHVWQRSKRLIKALGVPQSPTMILPAARWRAIRNDEPFLAVKAGPTQRRPDSVGHGIQLDPTQFGCLYEVPEIRDLQIFSVSAQVAPPSYDAGKEYWSVPTMPAAGAWPTAITFTEKPNNLVPAGFPRSNNAGPYRTASSVTWPAYTSAAPAEKDGMYFAKYTKDGVTWYVALDLSSLSAGTWTWHVASSGTAPPTYVKMTEPGWTTTKPTGFPTEAKFSKLNQP